MSTEELVSGVLEGLKLNALDLSALFRRDQSPAWRTGITGFKVALLA